jgi:hypothetical protein
MFMRGIMFHSDGSQSNIANATNMFNMFGAYTAFHSNFSQWNVTRVAARVHRAAPGEMDRTPYCLFLGCDTLDREHVSALTMPSDSV